MRTYEEYRARCTSEASGSAPLICGFCGSSHATNACQSTRMSTHISMTRDAFHGMDAKLSNAISHDAGEELPESAEGAAETVDFRALAQELYEAFVEVEFVGGKGVAANTCPRCHAMSAVGHMPDCDTGIAIGKAEPLLGE